MVAVEVPWALALLASVVRYITEQLRVLAVVEAPQAPAVSVSCTFSSLITILAPNKAT